MGDEDQHWDEVFGEPVDAEGDAVALYEEAGLDPSVPARSAELARRLLPPPAVVWEKHRDLAGDAGLVDGVILVRKGVGPERGKFAICHELAEWHLSHWSPTQLVEDEADHLAACLIAPRPAFRQLIREHGDDWAAIARALTATETLVALRWAEVTGEPLAVVSRRVRVRGEAYGWPDEPTLRRLARGRHVLPGVRKVPLSDDPGRCVLRGAG